MAAYCIFDVKEVRDPDRWEEYRSKVGSIVEAFGGRYLAVGGRFDIVEGTWQPIFPVIIEFESREQAHRWYSSEEYKDLLNLRLEITEGDAVFVEGL